MSIRYFSAVTSLLRSERFILVFPVCEEFNFAQDFYSSPGLVTTCNKKAFHLKAKNGPGRGGGGGLMWMGSGLGYPSEQFSTGLQWLHGTPPNP